MTDFPSLVNDLVQTEMLVIALLGVGLLSLGVVRKNGHKKPKPNTHKQCVLN